MKQTGDEVDVGCSSMRNKRTSGQSSLGLGETWYYRGSDSKTLTVPQFCSDNEQAEKLRAS